MNPIHRGLFQRTSSFDEEAYARKEWQERLPDKPTKLIEAKATSPERSDLERWYQALRDICENDDHLMELEDLKDEIYGFLY
jgi:hypothetical protein